jgi:hypothetical protein
MLKGRLLDLRAFRVTELGSLDLNPSISGFRLVANLGPNMFAFAITIGPDE